MKNVKSSKCGVRPVLCFVFALLDILLSSLPTKVNAVEQGSFDFIVVGAGASGCVIASGLSEKYSVLLLEEGGDPNPDLDVPAKTANFFNNKEYVKAYKTVPQNNAGLMNKGVFVYLVGNTLGGGTSVNGNVHNRGSPHDYDNWANITGDSSWRYENMLKYFKKMEDYHGGYPSEEHHGKGGPIPITRPEYAPGLDTWLEAGKEMGYTIADPNGPQKVSFAPIEFSRRHGRRVSAFRGYIEPLLGTRKNLKLIKNAKVDSVILDGNKAVGVKYLTKDGNTATARVSKEVILSAGVIASPVILMKSGIGPEDVLKAAKITPVKYLPVGNNLQDHVFLQIHINMNGNKSDIFIPERDLTPETWKQYQESGDGPYSNFNGVHAQAFLVSSVRAKENAPNPEWADINLHLVQAPSSFGVDGMAEVGEENRHAETSISTVIMLSRPKSRGSVKLNARNIDEDPLVDFQYLTHPDDMEAMIDAVKQVIKLHEETASFREQGAHYPKTPLTFCKHLKFRSDDYWKCYISHMTTASAHAAGTCRMGSRHDEIDAVVDSKMRVIGINSLRVVDTSIMITVSNANTQAPALVIGEKAVDEILKHWNATNGNAEQHEEL